ncbi:MAG: hypothetical protein R3C56_27110 [Pirellulaceae bacterium]
MLSEQAKYDSQLATRVCQRDERAAEVIGLYGPQVQAACRRICADLLDAEGVVSQVFGSFGIRLTNMMRNEVPCEPIY